MPGNRHIRDPVHNFVELWSDELKVVNSPVFQRLRGIKQLALANLVYPGALHTRFDHSVGVCHVAGLMANRVGVGDRSTDDHDVRLVRLAALLHDLGHGPFSHVSEDALERYANREALKGIEKKEKIHESITARLIDTDPDLTRILGPDMCRKVVQILGDGYGERMLKNIVSGPLDADKQDYLLRDSRFCGVPYGLFDMHQLHQSLVARGDEKDRGLWITKDGIHALEQYVLAKYYLTTMVYRHQVRLITNQMITRAIILGIEEDDNEELRGLFEYDGTDAFVNRYKTWDDAKFFARFSDEGPHETKCGQMLKRLATRRLLKQVFSKQMNKFADPIVKDFLPRLCDTEHERIRSDIERGVAEVLRSACNGVDDDIDVNNIIVFAFTIKSVRKTSRDEEEGGIMIATEPDPSRFEDESALFGSINERYSDGFVEVYAPVEWATPADKARVRAYVAEPIEKVICDLCKRGAEGGGQS